MASLSNPEARRAALKARYNTFLGLFEEHADCMRRHFWLSKDFPDLVSRYKKAKRLVEVHPDVAFMAGRHPVSFEALVEVMETRASATRKRVTLTSDKAFGAYQERVGEKLKAYSNISRELFSERGLREKSGKHILVRRVESFVGVDLWMVITACEKGLWKWEHGAEALENRVEYERLKAKCFKDLSGRVGVDWSKSKPRS